jgi:hypothetical protein
MENKTLNQEEFQLLCKEQISPLESLEKEVEFLRKENAKLKALLAAQSVSSQKVERIEKSNEELLCESQIKRLKEYAFSRELTLEEVKKMDLLVKNLNLARGKNTSIVGKSKKNKDITDAQLIEVVKNETK